ncbi:MAG TPA: hypothetical protein VI076_10975, partial [Actinopolymorphaceae bacterium]
MIERTEPVRMGRDVAHRIAPARPSGAVPEGLAEVIPFPRPRSSGAPLAPPLVPPLVPRGRTRRGRR